MPSPLSAQAMYHLPVAARMLHPKHLQFSYECASIGGGVIGTVIGPPTKGTQGRVRQRIDAAWSEYYALSAWMRQLWPKHPQWSCGAHARIRTGDLFLTKEML